MEAPRATAPLPAAPPRYQGVGGWLLLLCLSLAVFTPLVRITVAARSISAAAHLGSQYPDLLTISIVDAICTVGVCAFSVYAGIQLWKVRPKAVRTAQRCLVVLFVYSLIEAAMPFSAGLPPAMEGELAQEAVQTVVRALIYFGVWRLYLERSRRVEATYES